MGDAGHEVTSVLRPQSHPTEQPDWRNLMETILRGLLVMATAGALAFPAALPPAATSGHSRGRSVAAPTPKVAPHFAADQLEAYLNDDGIAYIRPGVKVKINTIT